MCRLIGEFCLQGSLTEERVFSELTLLSKAGGPDSTAFYRKDRVQFGFNRLAILDLSETGMQPMVSSSGRYVIVFNGEVYNHKELKSRLVKFTKFVGTSDTETIVHCIDEWGVENTIKQLDGMFAIAVYDKYEEVLHLSRDFAGIKPLYYGVNSSGVAFSSQFDQIAKHQWFKHESIDKKVLSLYLHMHYISPPYGLLTNTFQVLPGEIVSINSSGSISKKRYWELPTVVKPTISETKEALLFIENELNKSVKNQLMADVPLGAFLSGGIDSALICNFASKNIKDSLSTYTIGSDSKIHDESEDAKKLASLINAQMHVEMMDSNYASMLIDDVFNALSEPFADFSIIPTYLVSKLARKSVTVSLSGDGGDELFFGYQRFESILKNRNFLNLPYSLKYLMYGADRVLFRNKHINSGVLFNKSGLFQMDLHSRFRDEWVNNIFPAYSEDIISDGFGVYNYPNSKDQLDLLSSIRYGEFYGMMQKTLRKVDQASMGVGLEVRVPFLSKQFIESALMISPSLSHGPGKKKDILKTLLRTQLPEAVITQQKKGFTVPLRKWINQDLKEYFDDTLMSDSFSEKFGFNKSGIESLLKIHHSNEADAKWPLFTILSLYKWQEKIER